MHNFIRPALVASLCVVFGLTGTAQSPRQAAPRVERGELTKSDEQLDSGEFVDRYEYRWQANQRVRIELIARDFDGYLILVPPKGDQVENDDADDDEEKSSIEMDLDQAGTYEVAVTSYEGGETGEYTLRVTTVGRGRTTSNRTDAIAYGQVRNGELEDADSLREDKFVDAYSFNGREGDRITIEMASDDIDTLLTLIPPDGSEIENDDADGDQDLSRIALTLRQAGRYQILASSYDDKEVGAYRLSLNRDNRESTTTSRRDPEPSRGGNIYGLFVGISDYEGDDNDLEYTADDARNLQRALVRGAGMRESNAVTLVDRQATRANVVRALEEVGRNAGPDDLFVFFFSGHGDRTDRSSRQAADPDGLDETITLYDEDITDDEMNKLLAPIRARVLFALDSCFAGGFSKDVISSPRRMGLFSSEEDVTSGVADKFRAGGFLSKFLFDGIAEQRADKDRNGDITAIELSQYLHDRYRSDVKSSKPVADNFVSTSGRDTGYQHLVVDRGSIAPFEVLFRR